MQAYRAADADRGQRVLRAFGSRPQSAADARRRSVHLLPAAELCAFDGGRAVQWSGDVQCGIRRLAAGCGGSQPEPAGWQRLEIVLLLLCAGVYVLLWRFAPLSKAVLLAILTALQLVGMFVFIKLNGWMLEKKYAV